MPQDVIEQLGHLKGDLKGYDERRLDQPVGVYADTWMPRLKNWPPGQRLLAERATEEKRGRPYAVFNRNEFPGLAHVAIDNPSDDNVLRLFVVCQLWGSGTLNGRGPRYLVDALADVNHAAAVLRETLEQVTAGQSGRAYQQQHRKLHGWGRAFVSKFLYAVALGVDRERPPALILDSRVWEGLKALKWSSSEAAGTNRWDRRYEAYVEQMHSWADALDCRADSVERLLFDRRNEL